MATLRPLDIQYGLTLNGVLVLDRERNLAVENASIKNLQVTGSLDAINATNTYIKDNNILLNSGVEPGAITTLGTITGGSNYTTGNYKNVPLAVSSGTTGLGATADITVNASGAVSVVTIVNGGYGYATDTVFTVAAADIDSDSTPNGTGFSVTVSAVSAGSASTDAFITVSRGTTGADVALKWDETTTDRWQLTNDGTNYFSIYVTDDASTAATANKLVLRDASGNITVATIGATDGTFSGDVAVNGGDITTTATGATTIFNTNTTNLSIGGAATTLALANTGTAARTLNIATTATAGASTLTFGGAVTGNILKVASTAAGTVNVTTDVTTGIANIFTSLTTGTLNLATGGASTTNIGGAGGNLTVGTTAGNSTLTINGNGVGGTATLTTNVTTGIVNAFTGVTTGTLNLATGGASTTNIGGAAGNVNIGTTAGNSTLTVRGNGTGGTTTIATNVTTGIANIFTSVTGTVNIGGVGSNIYLGTQAATQASTTTVASITQTATDTFAAATFRSAEYLVQIVQGSAYQISKILLTHDGTTAYITEYGTITSGSVLGTLDADIATGNVRLLVTMGSATSATVKVLRTTIVV
jgi:fibronectin-binding autotransporter adhesin